MMSDHTHPTAQDEHDSNLAWEDQRLEWMYEQTQLDLYVQHQFRMDRVRNGILTKMEAARILRYWITALKGATNEWEQKDYQARVFEATLDLMACRSL